METKSCSSCGIAQPLDNYFVRNKAIGKLHAQCKTCMLAKQAQRYQNNSQIILKRQQQYYHSHKDEILEHNKRHIRQIFEANSVRSLDFNGLKNCVKCGQDKDYSAFQIKRSLPDGHDSHCRVCRATTMNKSARREYSKKWHRTHTDYNRQYRQVWRSKNKAHITQYEAEYAKANRVRKYARKAAMYQRNLEFYRAKGRTNYLKHRDKLLVLSRSHKARRRGAAGKFTPQEWLDIKTRYGFRCLCCGRHESEAALTVDHVIPIIRGGTNTADNIQCLCRSCNCSKFTKTIDYRPGSQTSNG